MDDRLKKALDKRDKLQTTVQRLRGRLDAALQEKESVVSEIKGKNIDPERLDETIDLLQQKHDNLLSQFESELEELQSKLNSYMEKQQ